MKVSLKRNKGITLIALVITIIVLIILAGISIIVLTGEDGLITKAKQGAQNYQNAAIEEQQALNTIYAQAGVQLTTGSTNNGGNPVNQGSTNNGETPTNQGGSTSGTTGGGLTEEEHNALMKLYNKASIVPDPDFDVTNYQIVKTGVGAVTFSTEEGGLYVLEVGSWYVGTLSPSAVVSNGTILFTGSPYNYVAESSNGWFHSSRMYVVKAAGTSMTVTPSDTSHFTVQALRIS